MKNDVKQDLQSEVLISCLDVLCRANATVFESDPKLAADITQAIEALSNALQNDDPPVNTAQTNAQANTVVQHNERPLEPADYLKKNIYPEYFPADDTIVDVLTNEVIRQSHRK
ncbi:MAG: hypothetical protein KKC76_18820 [Proteobacteria bacterium]|nr:hypothetical protein [Pseudomonadota bacterium]MBU4295262.1 hypothetical protein [Pseudomonadota bacterium]MCG2750198.1 hypothetical protein [Desulfobulbaceae bacterium]